MRRWIILLGRGGTVLLAIGLALLLVSLIPAAQTNINMGSNVLFRRTWSPWGGYEGVLTPQQGLHFIITANATLNVYVFEVSTQTIFSWISEHYPDSPDRLNATYLEGFLEVNPNAIGWNASINNEKIEHEYIPTKITNATLAFSNPSLGDTLVEWQLSVTGQVAPVTKVRILAEGVIPIGFVLALPWCISFLRTRVRRGSQSLTKAT